MLRAQSWRELIEQNLEDVHSGIDSLVLLMCLKISMYLCGLGPDFSAPCRIELTEESWEELKKARYLSRCTMVFLQVGRHESA